MSINSNPIYNLQGEARDVLLSSLGRLVSSGQLPAEPIPDFNLEVPANTSHGDLAANLAMVCAKTFKMPPRKLAEMVISEAVLDGTSFSKLEAAGPGFINLFVSDIWFSKVVSEIEQAGSAYGRTNLGAGKRVLVEFVSANPTGPMHIGNARGGAIGDGLASLLEFAGYNVEREFYVNDAGNQVQKLGLSLDLRYLQLYKDNIEMPEDCYLGEDVIEHAKNFADIHGDSFLEKPEDVRRTALVNYALPLNIKRLEKDLLKYRIKYDNWFLESSLHNSGKVDEIIERMKKTGYTYELDGALWFKATEFGVDKDIVLVRSNGIPTYVVPDIAYHYDKLCTRAFDKAINVLGADHHGYTSRLRAAMKALGIEDSRLDFVLTQMVRLVRAGELVKASKRSGKAITLATLLDEVPIDAARFFFNLREVNTHLDFDLDLAVEQSSQNPVYYVQYAYARICSILSEIDAPAN
ncbi:MAG TPA: arginine--tRNA ligase, partial [Oscillospiraceae bacterium]|nr:arginine--tRNA ligase [Oscillospiraceae bacterium]